MINVEQVFVELDEIVAEYGADTTYRSRLVSIVGETGQVLKDYDNGRSSCLYTVDSQCACIIGVWLEKHGVRVPEDDMYNQLIFSAYTHGLLDLLDIRDDLDLSAESVQTLRVVQSRQDAGTTWGEAIAIAKGERDEKNH